MKENYKKIAYCYLRLNRIIGVYKYFHLIRYLIRPCVCPPRPGLCRTKNRPISGVFFAVPRRLGQPLYGLPPAPACRKNPSPKRFPLALLSGSYKQPFQNWLSPFQKEPFKSHFWVTKYIYICS